MATSYKLIYFPVKALAEPIRFLLSYGGLDFEDVRMQQDSWLEVKNDMPFGQVPVLEVDGKLAHQSVAISRYLAKQVKLTGADDWEDLEIDTIVDTICDIRAKIATFNMEKDEVLKEALRETLVNETLPYYLQRLDEIAERNDGHLALNKLTWADLYFVGLLDYCNGVTKSDIIENYPNLITVKENVMSIPAIKVWTESRPESEY